MTLALQVLSAGAAAAEEVVLVRAGRLFDSRAGRLLGARDVLVRDGVVAAVGERIAAPAGAVVLDFSGYTVLPGLVDAHAHLLMQHPGTEGSGDTGVREVVREGDALRALRGAARARSYLEAGFTSVRDLGNAGQFADVALRRVLREGALPGPRLFVAGPGLSPPGGQLDGILAGRQDIVAHEYRVIRGVDDARTAVRESAVQGVDQIKLYANASPNPGLLSVAEMRAVVEEAGLIGLPVTAHATTDAAILRALEAGVRSIEHGRGASPSTLARMRRIGAVLTPTEWGRALADLSLGRLPAEQRPTKARLDTILQQGYGRLAAARASGVEIAFGSDLYVDFGIPRGAAVRLALQSYVEAGFTPGEALRAATYTAGRQVARGKVGVLEPGAYADLIVVEGDPTRDLSSLETLRCVMLNGAPQATPGARCGAP